MKDITFTPIGIIESPFEKLDDMPIQPIGTGAAEGKIILEDKLTIGLKDLDGFSHLILIYNFHKCKNSKLQVTPFLDNEVHGVFATRAPVRPNRIGLSIVKLIKIEENTLFIDGVDMLNGTPLLDIKPYMPPFDIWQNAKYGWLQKQSEENIKSIKSDKRFKD